MRCANLFKTQTDCQKERTTEHWRMKLLLTVSLGLLALVFQLSAGLKLMTICNRKAKCNKTMKSTKVQTLGELRMHDTAKLMGSGLRFCVSSWSPAKLAESLTRASDSSI